MIINNGIINQGNDNYNNISQEFNFSKIKEELDILVKHTDDNLTEIYDAVNKKDKSKFIMAIKKLGVNTIKLINKLGLFTLEKIIEKYI